MKKLMLLGCLLFLSIPLALRAQNGDDKPHHKSISATEMGAIGSGVAAFLGAAGYLVLRRKTA